MGLFKPDLYRNFAIGFLLGAGVLVLKMEGVEQAVAATF